MTFPYPAKPWQDGQEVNVAMGGGYYVLGRYNAAKNLWSFRRVRDDQVNREQIFTFDVLTTLAQPSPRDKSPFDLTDPTNLQTQQDVNWFLWNYIRDLELEGAQVDFSLEAVLLEAPSTIDETFEREPNDYAAYGPAICYLNGPDHEVTTRIVIPEVDSDGFDWSSILRSYDKGDVIMTVQVDDNLTPDDLSDDINYRSEWEIISEPVENLHTFSFEVKHLKDSPPHLPAFGESAFIRLMVNPTSDLYVRKSGDTMTGPLVMNAAQGILMRDSELDFVRTGESLKDGNGDPVLDSNGDEQWDSANDRISHIESVAPILLKSDDTFGSDLSAPFGVRVEIDDGNTHRNRFMVGNRHGDSVTITGGTGPQVQFGTGFEGNQNPLNGRIDWADGEEGGVKITNIPTPTFDNPESRLAVNKRYVDERDELLRQDIIELEEEIDAIAPSLEYGTWEWEQPTSNLSAPEKGKFYLLDAAGQLTTEYKDSRTLVINNYEYDDPNDNDPVDIHTWADADPGELIQLFDAADPDFMLGKIIAVNADIETNASGTLEFVRIQFELIQSSGVPNDNPDPITGKFITRVNIFKEPSGGNASDFVLKRGDTMSGELEFYHEQADNSADYSTPSANTKDLRFSTKRLDTGGTTSVYLYQPGYSGSLVCSAGLMARSGLYTGDYLYGTTFNSDGTKVTKQPKIHLRRSVNSSGNVTSEYGALKFSSTELLTWDGTRIIVKRAGTNSHDGFTIKGTELANYTSSSGKAGDLLRSYHNAGDAAADAIFYYGKITDPNHIATKKYVDDKAGGVDISCSFDNRSKGDLWYCSTDQVMYLKVS